MLLFLLAALLLLFCFFAITRLKRPVRMQITLARKPVVKNNKIKTGY